MKSLKLRRTATLVANRVGNWVHFPLYIFLLWSKVRFRLKRSFIHLRIFPALFLKNGDAQEMFVNVLKESKSFLKYCWTTVNFALSFICENGYYPGATGSQLCWILVSSLISQFLGFDKAQLFLHVCNIAKVSLHYFMIERNNFTNYDVVWLALETYLFAFQYIYQWLV